MGIPVLPSLLLAERLTAATRVIPGAQRTLPDTAGSLESPTDWWASQIRCVLADTAAVLVYCPLIAGVHNFTTFSQGADASLGAPLQWRTTRAVFAFFTRAVSRSLLIVLTLLSICGIR